jgi:Flp pilus assembly pilin Flp
MKFSVHRQNECGQGLVEYALIIVGVAIAVVVAVLLFGEELSAVYCMVAGELGGEACGVGEATYCGDDFSNNEGWEFSRSGEDFWEFSDGKMCMTQNSYRDHAYNVCSQAMPSDDYIIRVSGAELSQGQGYGIFFRLQGYGELVSGYTFQYDPGLSGFVFRRWEGGHERTIAYKRDPSYDFYNISREIEVHVVGSNFKAYIDGELVLEANDSTYESGGTGFRTWYDSRACFEDFKILPVPAE